jgi:nucleotide-binding universal stress UspA family protein
MTRNGSRQILVATDGSPSAREAVEVGISLAASQAAEVTFLHVVPAGNGIDPAHDPALADAAKRARELGIGAHVEVGEGDASDQIVSRGDALGAALIVVGRGGRNFFKTPVSTAVAKRARRPVLVARGIGLAAA